MSYLRKHKDVEFAVDDAGGNEKIFKSFDDAAGFAVNIAIARGKANLDILAHSEAGAKHVMGDEGIEIYREDPDASIFYRIEIKANSLGRVP